MNIRSPETLRPRGLIAPRLVILLAVVVCTGALVLLTPSRSELFKRHMVDGDARAASLLLAQENAGNTDETTAAITAETIRICQSDNWKQSSLNMLTSFLRQNTNLKPAAEETMRHLKSMPSNARAAVLSVLVERSLADGELDHAEKLQTQLLDSVDVLDPVLVRQAVKTYRYNDNPALALVTINHLEEQRGSLPDDLRELRIQLARELSQPEVAFALLCQQVRSTEDPDRIRVLVPKAVKTGIEAGRQNELIPLYEKYLKVAKAGEQKEDSRLIEYAMNLAQTFEWTKQPDRAFDTYVELAAGGHRPALDRCISLNPGLFRQEDLMNALVTGYPHYHEDDKLLLMTARFLGDAALRSEAIRFYGLYLKRNPEDAEAHFRLGAVHDEGVQLKQALAHYRRAHQLAPDNDFYLSKLARLATSLQEFDEALGYLKILGSRTKKRKYVEQYYTLAEGLGDHEATKEALRLLISIGGRLSPTNYLYLANAFREEGNLKAFLATLQEAHKKHPRNPFVRLDLAEAYLFSKRPDLTLGVLKGIDLLQFPQGASTVLSALTALDRTALAGRGSGFLTTFGPQLEKSEDLTSTEFLALAEYSKKHGQSARAQRLFRKISQDSTIPSELAKAHFHRRAYQDALRAQLQHLKTTTKPTSHDYHLLGEIYSKLGQTSAADQSYRKALELLKKKRAQ